MLFITLASPPVIAQAPTREEVMADAARYAEHAWEMRAGNQQGTCQGKYRSDHALGKQVGVPYAWGGSMTLADFDKRIAAGHGAGSHSRDGVLSCVAGVDCSGFVSQVWRLPQRQSTSTLGKVTRPITLEELTPGDALNKAGSHVVLFAGTSKDGRPIIYEASGSASRVRLATPSWSYLSGYQPVRYPGIQAPTAVASKDTSSTPSPAPAAAQTTPAVAASSTPSPAPAAAQTTPAAASAAPSQVTTASASTPSASAPAAARVSLRYGVDVGFQAAAEDAQALGPDFLAAGPNGKAALYDRVRNKVLVLSRDGARSAFDGGHVDSLGYTDKGEIVIVDGVQHQLRFYSTAGKLLRGIKIPHEGILQALTLEGGVLYVTTRDGQRKPIAEIVDGKPRPPRPSVELTGQQALRLKERVAGGHLIDVGGETLTVPEKVRISARPLGPWVELVIAASHADGRVRVDRTLRKPGQVVPLPSADRGAYVPIADLAVAPGGEAVYLEPGDQAVSVAWVDAK